MKQFKRSLVHFRGAIGRYLVCLAGVSSFFAKVYYFISGDFDEEIKCVIKGKRLYSVRNSKNLSRAYMRRNIHRLEKGICSSSIRLPFATSYIIKTVETYLSLYSQCSNSSDLYWAASVLGKYFNLHLKGERLDSNVLKAYHLFCKRNVLLSHHSSMAPTEVSGSTFELNFVHTLDRLLESRRSVRVYKDRTVPMPLIREVTDKASTAPSACNRQPFRLVLLQDIKLIHSVGSLAGGTSGWLPNIHNLLIVVGDLSSFEREADRHLIYIDASLFMMQFILLMQARSIHSCVINWHDNATSLRAIRSILSLLPCESPVFMCAFGYLKDGSLAPYSKKKSSFDLLQVFEG